MVFDTGVHHSHQSRAGRWGTLTLCVALSLLLHAGLALLLPDPAAGTPCERRQAGAGERRMQLRFAAAKEEASQRPFAKTSPDERRQQPDEADFEGRHASRASGANDAPERRADAPLPSMEGEEREEIVTFDQQRQDGELAHEGRRDSRPAPPPTPPAPAADEQPATQPQPLARGRQSAPAPTPPGEAPQADSPRPDEGSASTRPAPPQEDGELKLRAPGEEPAPQENRPPAVAQGQPEGQQGAAAPPTARPPRVAVYDPSLAPDAQQPGFRTQERRTRSSGRFVFGRKPALNVAATPRGAYEAEIYRRIARSWYAACDEHRGDIIPGSITVSLRLTRQGRIANMQLMNRKGASLLQQSFSFGAIRRASLPPMPDKVQQDIVGELYEMILTFNFD